MRSADFPKQKQGRPLSSAFAVLFYGSPLVLAEMFGLGRHVALTPRSAVNATWRTPQTQSEMPTGFRYVGGVRSANGFATVFAQGFTTNRPAKLHDVLFSFIYRCIHIFIWYFIFSVE